MVLQILKRNFVRVNGTEVVRKVSAKRMLFFKVNDLLLLEKPRCREGDFCSDLSVLLLFMKAQTWNVKEVHVVIFVF